MRSLHLALIVLSGAGAAGCSPGASASAASSGGDDDGAGGSSGNGGASGDGGSSSSSSPSASVTTGTGSTTSSGEGGGGAGGPCPAGTILCEGNTAKVCDGEGGFSEETSCAPGVCMAEMGCTVCAPGSGTCTGDVSSVCVADGSGFATYTCDPQQGVTCNAATGHCEGACAPAQLGSSYIGCDYWPTVTAQIVATTFNFAVAVSNASDQQASILVTRGDATVTNDLVEANSVKVINLPWVSELRDAGASAAVVDGAYRLRTNHPVTVYQYSPIEYQGSGGFFGYSYTNDASVLFPANAMTGTYRVAARNSWYFESGGSSYPGFYAVTATQDATSVTLGPSATGGVVVAGGGVAANGTGTVVLNQGDVLQVLSAMSGFNVDPNDLTGTLVSADKPVQVVSGHRCTYVPATTAACDHLEESMPPVETLATEYIVTPPLIPTGGTTPKAQMVRVIATDAATTITYDPPQAGAPTSIANAGEWFEIASTAADFVVSADKPILVSQYMQGQDAGGGSGDPAMALAVATEQYRDEYLFHAPTNYQTNYVNVTAPTGAVVNLDGTPVSGFVPIGASGYGVARVALNNGGDGNHLMNGDEPFGISVYGYGLYTSYWYPGGLDLDKVDTQD